MKSRARWLIPLLMLAAVGWQGTRTGPRFLRVPVSPGPAPAWTLTNLSGQLIGSTNFASQVVVLNFWATWCPPCLREIPDLKQFHIAHAADGLTVVGLAINDAGPVPLARFVEKSALPYPVALATPDVLDSFGGVGSIPSTFIITRDGRFAAHYLGALSREELERAVAPLLARTPAAPAAPGRN